MERYCRETKQIGGRKTHRRRVGINILHSDQKGCHKASSAEAAAEERRYCIQGEGRGTRGALQGRSSTPARCLFTLFIMFARRLARPFRVPLVPLPSLGHMFTDFLRRLPRGLSEATGTFLSEPSVLSIPPPVGLAPAYLLCCSATYCNTSILVSYR